MFTIDNTITDVMIKEKNLIKAFFSMNKHQVATPEMMLEEARSYILFCREGGKISAFIGLHLLATGRKLFYAHSANPFTEQEMDSVSQEALEFVEGLGALIDEADFTKSSSEEKKAWMDKQDIFSLRTGEEKAAERKPEESAAPSPSGGVETPEQPAPQPPPQPVPPVYYVPPQVTPAPAPPAAPQPAAQPPQQAYPASQPVPPAYYVPPQPPQAPPTIYPPLVPPAADAQQAPSAPPVYYPAQQVQPPAIAPQQPVPAQQAQAVPQQQQAPQTGYPPQPQQQRTEQEVVVRPEIEFEEEQGLPQNSQARKQKQYPPAQQTFPGAVRKSGSRAAGERDAAAAIPAKRKQDILQTAIEAGIVKPPKQSFKKSPAASGVVSRDRESLARLLTSF